MADRDALLQRIAELESQHGHNSRRMTAEEPFVAPAFRGNSSEGFLDWLDDFNLMAHLRNWDDAQHAHMLPGFLRDTALATYRELDDATKGNYRRLCEALTEAFVPAEFQQFHSSALAIREQEARETIEQYNAALCKLVCNAYPTMGAEDRLSVLKTHFLKGLRPDIRRHILITQPDATYARTLAIAKNYDTAMKLSQGVRALTTADIYRGEQQVYAGFVAATMPSQWMASTGQVVGNEEAPQGSMQPMWLPTPEAKSGVGVARGPTPTPGPMPPGRLPTTRI